MSGRNQYEMRLTEYPRASNAIRRTKGGAGLGVFVLVVLLSLRAGLTPDDAVLRALPVAVVAYLLAWAAAITIWRQLALAELEAARARRDARVAQAHGELTGDA